MVQQGFTPEMKAKGVIFNLILRVILVGDTILLDHPAKKIFNDNDEKPKRKFKLAAKKAIMHL